MAGWVRQWSEKGWVKAGKLISGESKRRLAKGKSANLIIC